jgi:hypothetical protein
MRSAATWADARGTALALLRAAYAREVERLAAMFRPRFESGEFRGLSDADVELQGRRKGFVPPAWRFHAALEKHVRSRDAALLLLAASPFDPLRSDPAFQIEDLRYVAGECLFHDVLRVGVRDGWYRPAPDEWPTAGDLVGAPANAEARHAS